MQKLHSETNGRILVQKMKSCVKGKNSILIFGRTHYVAVPKYLMHSCCFCIFSDFEIAYIVYSEIATL